MPDPNPIKKAIGLEELEKLAQRTHAEMQTLGAQTAAAIKSGEVTDNTIKLYPSTDKSGDPAITLDLPAEYLLDQAKTAFVGKFAWSEAAYPGSTDPSLNNKPVMVLAVKGSDNSVAYSFLNMAALVDTYKAKAGDKDASTTVTVSGYEIEVVVNTSADSGNRLEKKADGLFVGPEKVAGATAGHFAGLDANGHLTDSGKGADDFVAAEAGKRLMTDAEGTKLSGVAEGATKVEAGETAGNIKIGGVETPVVTFASDAEVSAMLDEVFGAEAGA